MLLVKIGTLMFFGSVITLLITAALDSFRTNKDDEDIHSSYLKERKVSVLELCVLAVIIAVILVIIGVFQISNM